VLAKAKRDYYAVLGVTRDADAGAIKHAFRTLAGAYHPDVSTAPDAAERFREIAEAYEILSKPESRARYDRGGARGVAGFAAGARAGSGLFDDLVAAAAARARAPEPGMDVIVPLTVGYLDARRGATARVRYRAPVACAACAGSGLEGVRPCAACGGRGRTQGERVAAVAVPPGTRDGDRIVLAGAGGAGAGGARSGDLLLDVEVAAPGDAPAFRLVAAAGAAVAAVLLVVTLLLLL